jgi:hypothetical protein
MSLTPLQLEDLGRSIFGNEKVDKAKEKKEDALAIWNTAKNIKGKVSTVSDTLKGSYKLSDVVNRHAYVAPSTVLQNPLKASISEMPKLAKERAELVKTSSVLQQEGLDAAIKRMETNSPNYEFIPEASTAEYIVAKNKTTGLNEIAFRGTDPTAKITSGYGKGLPEPIMWPTILKGGHEGKIFDQHNLEKILENLKGYNIVPENIGHVSGYSMGGTKAHRLADMINKDTTLLNPLLGENFFKEPISPNTTHNIYRTTEDIATAQGILRPGKKMPANVKIDSIDPVAVLTQKTKGLKGIAEDVVALHDLDHFAVEGNRRSELRDAQEAMDARVEQYNQERMGKTTQAQKALQKELLRDIDPHLKVVGNQVQKFKARTGFMKTLVEGGRSVRGAGVGAVAGFATDKALHEIGIDDPYVSGVTAGGAAGAATEMSGWALGGAKSLMNLRGAVLGGGAAVGTQMVSSRLLNDILLSNGVDRDTAGIVSESVGGGIGGATSVLVPQALKAAARRSAITAARQAAMAAPEYLGVELGEIGAEAVAEVGAEAVAEAGAEAVAEAAAEVAVETGAEVGTEALVGALAVTPIPGARILAGMIIIGSLISGGVKVAEIATRPGTQVILHPTRSQVVDAAVADNARIKKLMEDFNKSQDRSEQAYTILMEDIESATRADPRIPSDFRYTTKLVRATEDDGKDIVRHFDYSNIPPEVANMTGTQFENAVGEAELYNQYRGIYNGNLTERQKKDFIEEMKQKYGRDITRGENDSLDAQFVRALNQDESAAERLRSEIAVKAADEVYQQGLKIQQGIDDYNDEMDVTNQVHQKFAEFISTSPKVKEFIDNGDINGLNVFLHNSIRDRNIVGVMYNDLVATHNKHEVLEVLHNNLPQFDADGKVSYITVGDKPLEISAELQGKFRSQAVGNRYANTYKEQSAKLADHPIGNALLNIPDIKQMIDKGSPPEDINQGINEYYKAHPTFRRSVDAGKITLPKFESDGSIKYTAARNPIPMSVQEQRAAHIARREQIHQIKPLDLGITPLLKTPKPTAQPPQAAQTESASAQ